MKNAYQIIGRTNGVGLDRDAAILREALTAAGIASDFANVHTRNFFHRIFHGKPTHSANIFLERPAPNWFGCAAKNILIPNQERFPARMLPLLARINEVWCKTHHAEEIFSKLGCTTRYIGFTSVDRKLAAATPDYGKFFHLAGRSTEKGTAALLTAWARHPKWPTLTLVQHPENAPQRVPANVQLIAEHLSDAELQRLQNEHGIHLCPSRCEGWGHYIVEAMSVGAVVVTTDAPPMNELVTADLGILVGFAHSEPRHLGTAYDVSTDNLEKAIERILAMTDNDKSALGAAARNWYDTNARTFALRLAKVAQAAL